MTVSPTARHATSLRATAATGVHDASSRCALTQGRAQLLSLHEVIRAIVLGGSLYLERGPWRPSSCSIGLRRAVERVSSAARSQRPTGAVFALSFHHLPPPSAALSPFFFSFCSSHAVCRVYVEYTGNGAEGCLTLVDLAGSEHKIDSMWCAAPPHTWTNNPTRWP